MLARVSNIEAFRRWREDEDQTVEELVHFITTDEPTEAMLAGTAFHKALELAQDGEHEAFEANGYTFVLPSADLILPSTREMRAYGQYGGLTVTGQVDAVEGRIVTDHKTTSKFDPERYLNGCQWKFYLSLFGADLFQWNIFELKELGGNEYGVSSPHHLTAYRYPELESDCLNLAEDYADFAAKYLPGDDQCLAA